LFFSPFFMLVVGLAPSQAVGAGLLTEVFGMGNGLRSYVGQKLVDFATAKWLLLGAVPSVVAGALLAHYFPSAILRIIFGVGLVILGGFILLVRSPEECQPGEQCGELIKAKSQGKGTTTVKAGDGTVYEYPTCWRLPGVLLASTGGVLTGLISAGLPEISTTQLVVRCSVPPRVAIATSVFVLAITAAFGAAIHAVSVEPAWHVVVWSIPGVLIGSTIGSRIGKYLPGKAMEKALASVFIAVGLLVLVQEFLP
jgi:uncharacterized membrane protein YfcA